jgi:hypothetical protein
MMIILQTTRIILVVALVLGATLTSLKPEVRTAYTVQQTRDYMNDCFEQGSISAGNHAVWEDKKPVRWEVTCGSVR